MKRAQNLGCRTAELHGFEDFMALPQPSIPTHFQRRVSICQHSHSKLFEISHWEGHRPFAFPADEDADEQLGSETLPQEVT